MGVDLYSFERNLFGLFELLTGEGVRFVALLNENLTVAEEFAGFVKLGRWIFKGVQYFGGKGTAFL